jgi:two-component system, chemotaxis family, protein-glutamate methylesterase/glutaminase
MTHRVDLVVVGVSAGGMDALLQLLSPLPVEFPIPVCVVQHRSADAGDFLARWLDQRCSLQVREAGLNSCLEAGIVYIAPSNYHLLVENRHTLALSMEDRLHYSRPSIDTLFESAAIIFKANLLAIVLTGANADGRAGAAAIKRCGGSVWVHDPLHAEFTAMPDAVIMDVAVDEILTLPAFAPALLARCADRNPHT